MAKPKSKSKGNPERVKALISLHKLALAWIDAKAESLRRPRGMIIDDLVFEKTGKPD